jgi:hypothetical protein
MAGLAPKPRATSETAAAHPAFAKHILRTPLFLGPHPQVSVQATLQLVRAGCHPLELQGIAHHLPRLQTALSALLASAHRAFGSATAWSGEVIPKDKGPQAVLLSWLLRLLPLAEPEGWPGSPLGLLPG